MYNRCPKGNNHQKVPNLFSEKPTLDHILQDTQMRSSENVKISIKRKSWLKKKHAT